MDTHGSFCFKFQGTDRQETFLASERSKKGQEVLHSPALHSDEKTSVLVTIYLVQLKFNALQQVFYKDHDGNDEHVKMVMMKGW